MSGLLIFQQSQGKLLPFIYMMARRQRVPGLASAMIRKS